MRQSSAASQPLPAEAPSAAIARYAARYDHSSSSAAQSARRDARDASIGASCGHSEGVPSEKSSEVSPRAIRFEALCQRRAKTRIAERASRISPDETQSVGTSPLMTHQPTRPGAALLIAGQIAT